MQIQGKMLLFRLFMPPSAIRLNWKWLNLSGIVCVGWNKRYSLVIWRWEGEIEKERSFVASGLPFFLIKSCAHNSPSWIVLYASPILHDKAFFVSVEFTSDSHSKWLGVVWLNASLYPWMLQVPPQCMYAKLLGKFSCYASALGRSQTL